MKRISPRWTWLLAVPVFSTPLFGHRLDEYLQATLVSLAPDEIRLELYLTPGVQMVEQLLPRFDPDGDGLVSPREAVAYADSVRHDLSVALDGRAREIDFPPSEFPGVDELRSGWGIIHLTYRASPSARPPGNHVLKLENHHLPELGVFLVNALQPGPPGIQVLRQSRSDQQNAAEITFSFAPPGGLHRCVPVGILLLLPLLGVLRWRLGKSRMPGAARGEQAAPRPGLGPS